MQRILDGVVRFRSEVFERQRGLFELLARDPQSPQALFITCSDSRINPNLLTQTEPGELFILRNAGNIIPPNGATRGGEEATIEYAVSVLGIRNIIVCGHSHCGAMKALLDRNGASGLPAVRSWFHHAETTRRIVRASYSHLSPEEQNARAIEQNVLVQMDNLRTHPSVATALSRGQLRLFGWVYVFERGEVLAHDPGSGRFLPIHEAAAPPVPARLDAGVGRLAAAE